MAKLATAVEPVALTAAPGADYHTLSYWLAALDAVENHRKYSVVQLDKGCAPHLPPVEFLLVFQFQTGSALHGLRCRLEQGCAHLLSIGKTLRGVDR